MKRLTIALALALLAGCATPPPEKVVTVQVEVAVPCLKPEGVPAKPVYQYGKGERPASGAIKAQLLAHDLEQADQYGAAWEAAAAGCLVLSGSRPSGARPSPDSSRKP